MSSVTMEKINQNFKTNILEDWRTPCSLKCCPRNDQLCKTAAITAILHIPCCIIQRKPYVSHDCWIENICQLEAWPFRLCQSWAGQLCKTNELNFTPLWALNVMVQSIAVVLVHAHAFGVTWYTGFVDCWQTNLVSSHLPVMVMCSVFQALMPFVTIYTSVEHKL